MSDELQKSVTLRERLRSLTPARVGLERAGDSVSLHDWLNFKMAHAEARDAVHDELSTAVIAAEVRGFGLDAVVVESEARDREEYLRRPERGRRLRAESAALLRKQEQPGDIAVVIADGLSALAVERHAVAVLRELADRLRVMCLTLAPVVIVRQGRVAVGDPIGEALNAKMTVVLIGERPGLSAPDSLGVYMTWAPRPGRTDAERNCISNIRAEGLGYGEAAEKIAWYVRAAMQMNLTGIELKDGMKLMGD